MSQTNTMVHFLRNIAVLGLWAIAATTAAAWAQASFRIISYLNYDDGPPGALVEVRPGTFDSAGSSAVFSITTQGAIVALATFPASTTIDAVLVSGPSGRVYSGSVLNPNPPAVFSVSSKPGTLQTYAAQTLYPGLSANLPDGTFLGWGFAGATALSYVVKSDLNGNVTPIYQFPNGEILPLGSPIYASDGNYYGVSLPYQTSNQGSAYVFRVAPSGYLTKLLTFPSGAFVGLPASVPLLQASDGSLYGATSNGGANGTGTVYKLTLAGQYTLLYTFPPGNNLYNPTALVEGSDGNLYGATQALYGGSQLFRVTTSGQYTTLYTFTRGGCPCWLTQGSDGTIYGGAVVGGQPGAFGEIFALNAGLPKPQPSARQFNPKSGAVGAKVMIWGYNLLSASVQFNGVAAATVSNSGADYVWATVPAGASTGPITVTTPGGTSTTKASFTVQ